MMEYYEQIKEKLPTRKEYMFYSSTILSGLTILLIIKSLEFEDRTFLKEKRRSEIAKDWSDIPFVDLQVTSDTECPGDTELAVMKPWLGTKLWCICNIDDRYE